MADAFLHAPPSMEEAAADEREASRPTLADSSDCVCTSDDRAMLHRTNWDDAVDILRAAGDNSLTVVEGDTTKKVIPFVASETLRYRRY